MASNQYFEFLGTIWKQLSPKDRSRLGETWRGFEQVFGSAYQRFAEANINVAVKDMLPFSTERWLPYEFNDKNIVFQAAVLTSSQDLSLGVNLSTRFLLRISVDGGLPKEVDVRGSTPNLTLAEEIVVRINLAFGFDLAKTVFNGTVVQFVSKTIGPSSSIEILPTSDQSKNASEFVLGILDSETPASFPQFPFVYALPYPKIASIPKLRNSIRDENLDTELVEGIDYIVENQTTISFMSPPEETFWAKRTLFDEEVPFNNYGFLMDIYLPNSQRYVEVLQGLWFAFWTGPKPSNVKISLYLLFGLPTAKQNGVVTDVTASEITVEYSDSSEVFPIPSGLTSLVSVGESVVKFQPLVSGIEVFDKINRPGFVEEEIGRAGIQQFLTENATLGFGDTDETKALRTLEEYTYLPQISVDAFISPDINLGNVKIFLDAIKPLNKTFLFQVIIGDFREPVGLTDRIEEHVEIDLTPTMESNETTYQSQIILDDYELNDNDGLNLDPDSVLFQERVTIEVYQAGLLIDTLNI